MKQRKILDINSKLSAEALIDADGRVELNLKIGNKDYRVASEEIRLLRDWLTKEVLGDVVLTTGVPVQPIPTTQPLPNMPPMMPKTPSGIILPPGVQPLEERRVVSATLGVKKRYNTMVTAIPDIQRMHTGGKLEMEAQNLAGNIEAARDAFSPANLNKDVPM